MDLPLGWLSCKPRETAPGDRHADSSMRCPLISLAFPQKQYNWEGGTLIVLSPYVTNQFRANTFQGRASLLPEESEPKYF